MSAPTHTFHSRYPTTTPPLKCNAVACVLQRHAARHESGSFVARCVNSIAAHSLRLEPLPANSWQTGERHKAENREITSVMNDEKEKKNKKKKLTCERKMYRVGLRLRICGVGTTHQAKLPGNDWNKMHRVSTNYRFYSMWKKKHLKRVISKQ